MDALLGAKDYMAVQDEAVNRLVNNLAKNTNKERVTYRMVDYKDLTPIRGGSEIMRLDKTTHTHASVEEARGGIAIGTDLEHLDTDGHNIVQGSAVKLEVPTDEKLFVKQPRLDIYCEPNQKGGFTITNPSKEPLFIRDARGGIHEIQPNGKPVILDTNQIIVLVGDNEVVLTHQKNAGYIDIVNKDRNTPDSLEGASASSSLNIKSPPTHESRYSPPIPQEEKDRRVPGMGVVFDGVLYVGPNTKTVVVNGQKEIATSQQLLIQDGDIIDTPKGRFKASQRWINGRESWKVISV